MNGGERLVGEGQTPVRIQRGSCSSTVRVPSLP